MNDDYSSTNGPGDSLLDRLRKSFSSEPRDREDLKQTIADARGAGILDQEAHAMIEGALSVSEMQVRDVMVPRSQMVVLSKASPMDVFLPLILESGHSRFPVVGEDKDEIEGILLAKDLLPVLAAGDTPPDLSNLIRPAVVIPESKRLNVLLRDFRSSRNHMAIVVDEYGGVSGLVTIEDVLEEIVGEIDDEHDEIEGANIRAVRDGRYMIQALTPIEEFNEVFGCHLSDEDFDTIGGLILAAFGRLPEAGEAVNIDHFQFQVIHADKRRLHQLEMSVVS